MIASGAATLVTIVLATVLDPLGMNPPTDPPTWPHLPVLAVLAIAWAAGAGVVSASPPEERT